MTLLRWRVVSGMASYLSDPLVSENFASYGTTLSGVPQIRERWKQGVSLVEGVPARPSASCTSRGTTRPPRTSAWCSWWTT